jgi:glutamate racemase
LGKSFKSLVSNRSLSKLALPGKLDDFRTSSPIGVFDSGVGGLTVLEALVKQLPNEQFIYLGDTAHLPYGNKAPATVLQYARQNSRFLLQKNIKLLVIACHTACSHAEKALALELPIPVIGVTEPTCDLILKDGHYKRIAILGTSGTIASKQIEKTLQAKDPSVKIFSKACPLFVPLVEDGLHDHPSAALIAEHYLSCFKEESIDAAFLACTHYPLLKKPISIALGPKVSLIEPANAVAKQVEAALTKHALHRLDQTPPVHQFYSTEDPEKFQKLASLFFKERAITATQIAAIYT